jgi:hypothetical protein
MVSREGAEAVVSEEAVVEAVASEVVTGEAEVPIGAVVLPTAVLP